MRIITGKYKGRKLKSFANNDIRPLMDRSKKFIFDVLQHEIRDAKVCDLFAGTGSFGIEAISQGAQHVTFVDDYAKAVKSIEHNISSNQITEPYLMLKQDVKRFVKRNEQSFDIIFCDAPYEFRDYPQLIESILSADMINEDGRLIVEHFAKIDLPEQVDSYKKTRVKKFGKTHISFFQKEIL